MMSEDTLCKIFASKLVDSPDFTSWLLGQTKFKTLALQSKLLHEEQAIRPAKHWWRHWWCKVPELDAESETDIFVVFEIVGTKLRFALHIECKLANGKFMKQQAQSYAFRGRHMLGKPKYLNYFDFETILVAPDSFRSMYRSECNLFDRYISFNQIAKFIPEFAN